MNEQQISLPKLLYRILREWRKWFFVALIGAIIVGGGFFVLKEMQFRNPENLENARLNYESKLNAFTAEGENIQHTIDDLEEMKERQEVYNEESLLMQIDPFHKFYASVQLYVSTDYKIMPELTYQNIDLSKRILYSYVTYMRNGDMYQYIIDHLAEKIELRYLQEMVFVSEDANNGMVALRVQGADEHFCEEVMSYALEGIYAKQADILEIVGDHELNSFNRVISETVDMDLDTQQRKNRQYVLDLGDAIKEKQDELAAWKRTSAPEKQYELMLIIKNSVKKMILVFIILMVLIAGAIAFCYIISDKVQDVQELNRRFGLRVIAQIPRIHKRRVWRWLDRMFACICGLTLKESDEEKLSRVAAQSICIELAACTESANKKSQKLVFTGSAEIEDIKNLLSHMEWESGISACSVSNVLYDPSAVSAVMDADYVILVEKQEESRYSQIGLELERFEAWKKKVLGVIVLGVDGIPA